MLYPTRIRVDVMKKTLLFGCMMVFGILSAVNLNLAFDSKANTFLSLSGIEALANGELGNCPVCGKDYEDCYCDASITCDYGGCWGRYCHVPRGETLCPCKATGSQTDICLMGTGTNSLKESR